jgi:PBP1b-binding outer membrane lipoprotein LpoB
MKRILSLCAALLFFAGCTEAKSRRTSVIETSMGNLKF